MLTLTRQDARRIAVSAQLLDAARPGDVVEVAEQLTSIKIDPTSVIAPCEHTMAFSRIGPGYETHQLQKAVEDDRLLLEFVGTYRPASIIAHMRPGLNDGALHAATQAWLAANAAFRADIVARLRAEGPLAASGIPDTSQVAHSSESGWYGPTQTPRMLEIMQRAGDVAVTRREGRTRIWDLAERVYPDAAPDGPSLEERTLTALGIVKQKSPWSRVGTAGVPARVEGSTWTFRVDPAAVERLNDDPGGRVAILNPYDTMLFDRPRLTELFDFTFVLEQFKPKAQRVYGAFAHPVLVGDRFVGLLDAAARDGVLRVNALHELEPLDEDDLEAIRAEVDAVATWLGVELAGL